MGGDRLVHSSAFVSAAGRLTVSVREPNDYWLALGWGIPRRRARALREALRDDEARLPDVIGRERPNWSAILRARDEAVAAGYAVMSFADPDYPELLRSIPDPPAVLTVRGDPSVLSMRQVAIVGARRPTPAGVRIATGISESLAGQSVAITSGLAAGIDSAAHVGALNADAITIAVLGNGLGQTYPAANRHLAAQIAERGALVSEYPPRMTPRRHHFPERNRLVSGLALAVLVIEAGARSGALITARAALEQGRDVMAVPGSILSELSRGSHQLIKDGAALIENADDVIAALWPQMRRGGPPPPLLSREVPIADWPSGLEVEARTLIEVLTDVPQTADELARLSGLTVEVVSSILFALALRGHVQPLVSGSFVRV
ncbi:MAG: DNA-processing protein DprA [Pseudomonadota bacterium]